MSKLARFTLAKSRTQIGMSIILQVDRSSQSALIYTNDY